MERIMSSGGAVALGLSTPLRNKYLRTAPIGIVWIRFLSVRRIRRVCAAGLTVMEMLRSANLRRVFPPLIGACDGAAVAAETTNFGFFNVCAAGAELIRFLCRRILGAAAVGATVPAGAGGGPKDAAERLAWNFTG